MHSIVYVHNTHTLVIQAHTKVILKQLCSIVQMQISIHMQIMEQV